jgi:phospholipid transport system substrate-binding protein
VVDRPNSAPATVEWVVTQPAATPRIVDVIAEGTSLRITQRSDYAAYLQRNGNNIDALLAAMKSQVEANR